MSVYNYKGYDIYVSDKPNKKYYAKVGNRKVYFGKIPYEQYKDKIGYYSNLDHLDTKRRSAYRARHGAQGYQTKKGSAAWFSWNLLW